MVISEVDGVRVVEISGVFDISNASEVVRELQQAAAGQRALIVVLERCSRIDLDGIAGLVALQRRFRDRLVLVGAQYRAFEITGVHKVFRTESTVDDAVRSLKMMRSEDEKVSQERSADRLDEDPEPF